jgi:predicted ATPase
MINIQSCIDGLWLSSGYQSYLTSWFPSYRKNLRGTLIPLKPGLNVIYGRNGSGKSQLLGAISSVAEYKMSAYEGFVLVNPRLQSVADNEDPYVFNTTPKEVLKGFRQNHTEDMDLGWLDGFDPTDIPETRQQLVLDIIGEFLRNKRCLFTREPIKEEPSVDKRERMNAPQKLQLAPMLMPSDEAPITREHAKAIHASYVLLIEGIEESIHASQDASFSVDQNDENYRIEILAGEQLLYAWCREWSWSPLLSLRNIGFLDVYGYELYEYALLWESDTSPLFLPAIFIQDAVGEYVEFGDFNNREKTLSLTLEKMSQSEKDESFSDVTASEIDYHEEMVDGKRIVKEQKREELLKSYVERITAKLQFLPGLRNLSYEIQGPLRHFHRETTMHLVLGNRVDASKGSTAERRWLDLARMAVEKTTQWVIIDEPESGLHRTAEADLAVALASPEWSSSSIVVVATHSPEFLELPNAHVLHVDSGVVRELTGIDRDELANLGLRPADLLTQINTFLLVEGEHERIVFETLFPDELRRLRCKIIVARGAKNMKDIFESQMIFNFSDATIISLLDNIDAKVVTQIWSEARKLASTGKVDEAGEYVRTALPGAKSGENVFLSEFLTLALANGQHERVEVWGLSKADIVLYLSPQDFGIKRTWEELLEAHTPSDPSFKFWATKKYGADFSVDAVLRATKALDHIPGDFGDLLMQITHLKRHD